MQESNYHTYNLSATAYVLSGESVIRKAIFSLITRIDMSLNSISSIKTNDMTCIVL